ncbi:hypothetical protein MUA04_03270 [Enterobacteriaceae bacterium H11S18]|uniref:hypothetical protein n=1 Tax=Dryocola clanedunensis TaxID=2925396 RepID=UPI0022F009FA|nr:hypothetical protein [Dryocola clanedunensis]MCT4709216.1 hypothetical protein [Dryocola clanedunensis]
MKKPKMGIKSLIWMILVTGSIFSLVIMLANIATALLIYFRMGTFPLTLHDDFYLALRNGFVVGAVTAIGLWLMGKIQGR